MVATRDFGSNNRSKGEADEGALTDGGVAAHAAATSQVGAAGLLHTCQAGAAIVEARLADLAL